MRVQFLVRVMAHSFPSVLVLLTMVGAQTTPPRQPALVLRSKTRLVQLVVVARDQKGQPVTDLQKGDFTVEDEGKPQQIRFFSDRPPKDAAKHATPLLAGIYSNRLTAHSDSAGITVILLDGLNTRWGDQAFARKVLIEYLSQIQPHDHVALYTLGKDFRILHDFNDDPGELIKSLAAYRGQLTSELQASNPAILGIASLLRENPNFNPAILGIASLLRENPNFFMRTRVLTTLTTLEGVAKYLAGAPGRKSLVWVSAGFPVAIRPFTNDDHSEWLGGDPRYSARTPSRGAFVPGLNQSSSMVETYEKEFQNAVRALSAANVSVYPVDARGLTASASGFNNVSTMKNIARDTGGKAYYNRNDLMNSIREAVQDSAVAYNLAYYPSEQNLDGRFRKVTVAVNRPGLSIRYRPGYYDDSNPVPDESAKETAIREAVWSPLDATAVGLEAQLNLKATATPGALELRLKVDAGNLILEERNGRWVGQFDMAVVQTDERGGEHHIHLRTVPLDLAQDAYKAIMNQGLILSETVQRKKAAAALRVVVRDTASGMLGRVTIPFQTR